MMGKDLRRTFYLSTGALLLASSVTMAQSGATRPRRTLPNQPTTETSNKSNASSSDLTATPVRDNAPRRNTTTTDTATAATTTTTSANPTAHAFSLLQQKQYDAALKEAKQIAANDQRNSEAWKIAGFAEFNLKQYEPAAADLQRALELQRTAGEEDANTVDALAQAYARLEKYEQALPLLVTATTRKPAGGAAAQPDPVMLYYRGIAEYSTGKAPDAERSFNAAIKADPKNSAALFYLGRIAYDRNDLDAAIAALNRATLNDSKLASAWALLTTSYLKRAATVPAKADADYLSAVRAGEGLARVANDETAATLLGQALIGANQFARAATTLERAAAKEDAQGSTLYLLGISYSRTKNFPKAIAALERARVKNPQDANVYRELGYAYEVSKQYAKALDAYQKGLEAAPDDADFKASVERVRPFAK